MAVAAACHMVMDEVRMDSVMAVEKFTIIIFGRFNFFSCCRKYIHCWTFLVREPMFSSHFKSWVLKVPRERNDSTVSTGQSHRVVGAGRTWLYPKSTVISIVLKALSSKLLSLQQVTRWLISHL